MLLFNPSAYDAAHYDEPTRRALLAVRRFSRPRVTQP